MNQKLRHIFSRLKDTQYKRRLVILGLVFTFFLVFFLILILKFSSLSSFVYPTKSWRLELAYNTRTKAVTIKKMQIISVTTPLDDRPAMYSHYSLSVYDSSKFTLYTTKIYIREEILDYLPTNPAAPKLPDSFSSVVYIPYLEDGKEIDISRDNAVILQIKLPYATSVAFPKKVYASQALPHSECGMLQVVFINDNYDDVNQFRSNVAFLKNLYNSTPPYNTSSSIFDFQEIDEKHNFGCDTDIYSCFNNYGASLPGGNAAIEDIGKGKFPSAKKFIVIADAHGRPDINGLGGITGGPGDSVAIYTNRPAGNFPAFGAATHEFLGHDVGVLYDRYVINDDYFRCINKDPAHPIYEPVDPQVVTNCSNAKNGTYPFPGCANHTNYSHSPLTCNYPPVSYDPNNCAYIKQARILDSGGTTQSVMGSLDCTTTSGFDSFEQNWIRNNIIPLYQKACPTETPSQVQTQSPTAQPTLPTVVPSQSALSTLKIHAFIDLNSNRVQDAGETGYGEATITLSGANSGTRTTDGNGNAQFDNLPQGNYHMTATVLSRIVAISDFPVINVGTYTLLVPINLAYLQGTVAPTIATTPVPTVTAIPPTANPTQPTPPQTNINPGGNSDNAPVDYAGEDITPPPVIATCVPDSSCNSTHGALQLCTLICTPNSPSQPVIEQPTAPPITTVPTTPPPAIGYYTPAPDPCFAVFQATGLASPDCTREIKEAMVAAGSPSKPVIYLYPTKKQRIDVSLAIPGIVTVSDPLYPDGGWKNITAYPNGDLLYKGRKYSELFYESKIEKNFTVSSHRGFIVNKNNTAQTLRNISQRLGLNQSETNELVDYWVARLKKEVATPYVFISVFPPEEKEKFDKVIISPPPDTFIGFMLYFKPVLVPFPVAPLKFAEKPPKRVGFTAVDWGGILDQN